ncbi:MAG: four-carbon acid sugar kinase family protein [Halanaerobiales bacterium]|nr:four-carbon acid sugar kinase family protein [Halanaerobiales bacterium]
MIYIIADDLTGANDTGVQFCKQGYDVTVAIEQIPDGSKLKHNKVGVIDTETREVKKSEAVKKLNQILSKLQFTEKDLIYKKVDSTLRGNVGAEIELIMELFDKDLCILTPSFFSSKRLTIGGYLIVNDEPLGSSEYNQRNLDSGEASYIPSILNEQSQFEVGKIELKEVIKGRKSILRELKKLSAAGKKILVVDSVNDIDLENIFAAGEELDEDVLYSGSAGLANLIAKKHHLEKSASDYLINKSQVLIVNGSRSQTAKTQVDYFIDNFDVFELEIDIKKLLEDDEELNKNLKQQIAKYNGDQYLVIRPAPYYSDEEVINNLLVKNDLSFRQLGEKIRDKLGEIAALIIDKFAVQNVIVTGGDTLIGICRAIKADKLNVLGEVVDGVPITQPILDKSSENHLNFITKAGGFGERDTISEVVKIIERRTDRNHE